jgi:hypothetical protein
MLIMRLAFMLLPVALAGMATGHLIAASPAPSTIPSHRPGAGDLVQVQKSSPLRVAPPDAPTNLAAASVTDRKVDLTWTDNANDEDEYEVDRRLESEVSFTQIATLGVDATSFTDDAVERGQTYVYRVFACSHPFSCSDPSNELTVQIPPRFIFIGEPRPDE